MKIIAPTDFSDLSKSALIYAAQLAASTNNPLVLVYNAVFASDEERLWQDSIDHHDKAFDSEETRVIFFI